VPKGGTWRLNPPKGIYMSSEKVFKSATITPEEVLAADSEEFIIRLEVGKGFNKEKSRIVFDFMQRLGASPPTLRMNEESGYVEFYINNPEVSVEKKHWDLGKKDFTTRSNPPAREGARMIVLEINGRLNEGDTIEMHYGESTMGFGPGAKVTSVVPRKINYERINIRYFDSQEKGLPDYGHNYEGYKRPTPDEEHEVKFRVLPREPKRLRIFRKLDKAMLVAYDKFWNIVELENPDDYIEIADSGTKNQEGVLEFANKNIQIKSKSLPITDTPDLENVYNGMNIYFGDMHTHSYISVDCLERTRMDMTPGELMDFARYRAGLDFYAVTDHNNPGLDSAAHLIQREQWDETIADVKTHHKDGEFVVVPGFEYSTYRGDTVVLFNYLAEYGDLNPEYCNCPDLRPLWRIYKEWGRDYMTIPHFHSGGSLETNTWWENEDFDGEPVIEIFSDHGSYEREDAFESGRAECKQFRKDRSAEWFLKNGYKYGFVAHSDDHKGHVGVNGITAIYSENLDRDSVFDAYRKRRTYLTSNARIRLLFTANGELMGSEIKNTSKKEFLIDVVGESNLKKVDLFKNGDHYKMFVPKGNEFRKMITINDEEPSSWYVRVTQRDNHIAISSPVWFE